MQAVFINVFTHRERLLQALRTEEDLPLLIRRMAVSSLLCAGAYGAVLGAQIGGWQVISSPAKLPLVLLGTCVICITALYVMLALAGARLRWPQVIALALCSISASAVTMAALLPIAAFWTFTFQGGDRTPITLTHTAAFLLAGMVGVRFGLEIAEGVLPERRTMRVMLVWIWLYGLVAQQMAWLFRPHFHPTNVFMRPLNSGGSALESLFRIVTNWVN
jgi:hypothetical protein